MRKIALIVAEVLRLFYSFVKVKHIKQGINPSSVDEIYFNGPYLLKGFRIGVVAGMVALTVRVFQSSSYFSQTSNIFTLIKIIRFCSSLLHTYIRKLLL